MKSKTLQKNIDRIKPIKAWAFISIDIEERYIIPPDVCPIFSQRFEARLEKRKYPVYYQNTKIIPVLITPLK